MTHVMLEPSHPGPSLTQLRVADAMHHGVVTCPLETPLRSVARMMATYRIHAVIAFSEVVKEVPHDGVWNVVSDLDLIRAASTADLDELTAGNVAGTPVVTVSPDETLDHAAQLMAEHETAHLVVVDLPSARPIGVLSTLDVARALAGLA